MDSREKQEYFESFKNIKPRKLKKLLENSTEKELCYLSELFINYKTLVVTKREEKRFKRYQKIIKRFTKRKWTMKQLKAFCLKHSQLILLLITTFLSKLLEGFVCNVISQDE